MNVSALLNGSSFSHISTHARWGGSSTTAMLILVVASLSNGIVLLAFAKKPALRTPFTILLICLTLHNFVYTICTLPFFILARLYSGWWMGSGWCTFYLYNLWCIATIGLNLHLAISTNRIWALASPISFRQNYGKKTAYYFSLVSIFVGYLVTLPGIVLDAAYFRIPETRYGCGVNVVTDKGMAIWNVFSEGYLGLALVVFIGSLPYIWKKERDRHKRKASPAVQQSLGRPTILNGSLSMGTDTGKVGIAATVFFIEASRVQRFVDHLNPLLLLSLLTLSVIIFWTPSMVYTILSPFVPMDHAVNVPYLRLIMSMQLATDPFLFSLAIGNLRNAILELLGIRKKGPKT